MYVPLKIAASIDDGFAICRGHGRAEMGSDGHADPAGLRLRDEQSSLHLAQGGGHCREDG